MNIVEALKLSKIIKFRGSEYNFEHTTYGLNVNDLMSEYWEPIIEKKTVKKTFYQAVFSYKDESRIFISDILFANSQEAETCAKEHAWCFHKLLTDSPIEVEVKT